MESPFACWMERLTLENPEHGIPSDVGSRPPADTVERQDDIAETLRSENKDVCLIDWDADEPFRRSATVQAMRQGVDFIVNGQLALGTLSGPANLLMRTSGYSSLGDYLYIPCDTQGGRARHAPFRLCFLAELLRSLQGQLPPQLLLIDGDDLLPLQTDDYIHHYRAVLQRFRAAMDSFRKHRMPEPAESSHFGRWGDCARELLKQRMQRQERGDEEPAAEESVPLRQAVGDGIDEQPEAVAQGDAAVQAVMPAVGPRADRSRGEFGFRRSGAAPSGPTLAEQARMLRSHTAAAPGPLVERRVAGSATGGAARGNHPAHNRRASDTVLQDLEFIGITRPRPQVGAPAAPRLVNPPPAGGPPSPALRDPRARPAVVATPEPDDGDATLDQWPVRTTGYLPEPPPRRPDIDRPVPPATAQPSRAGRWTPAPLDELRTAPDDDAPAPLDGLRIGPDGDPAVVREESRTSPEGDRPEPTPAPAMPGESSPTDGRPLVRRLTGQPFAPGPNVDLDSSLPVSPPTSLVTAELELPELDLPELELPEEAIAVVEDADAAFEEYQRLRAKARLDVSRSPGEALITSDREGD